ncbi:MULTISPECIES: hypothetical protein [Mycolicibacterium]|nr:MULTISPECIES: hypothetical protein [Mycolicibacterium]MCX8558543.1 hypothetical protein [Mycolicibacterium mucogenicum]UCZ63261.1 hypothetical protein LHJ73_14390 [Mycolicibacterium phocaicum]
MRHRRRQQNDNDQLDDYYHGDDDADDHVAYDFTRHRHRPRRSHGWWWP